MSLHIRNNHHFLNQKFGEENPSMLNTSQESSSCQVTKPHSQCPKQKAFGEYPHTVEVWECTGWIQEQLDLGDESMSLGFYFPFHFKALSSVLASLSGTPYSTRLFSQGNGSLLF